jgi:hypothetical protein
VLQAIDLSTLGDDGLRGSQTNISSILSASAPQYPLPTDEERRTLRRVPEVIPWIVWVLYVADFAEGSSFFGASRVYSNFVQMPLPQGIFQLPRLDEI